MELKNYKADLHLHTVLSPCGDIYMSPSAIVEQAKMRGLDIIAICDHNTTRQVKVTQHIGKKLGLFVIGGVEVTTKEEAHVLAYFETDEQLDTFQEYLDKHRPRIPLDEDRFGYQLIVDEDENVIGEEECLLLSAIDSDIDTLELSKHITKAEFLKKNAYLKRFMFTKSSDAHFLQHIGEAFCVLSMREPSFEEFRKAIRGEDGRLIITEPVGLQ